MLLRSLGALLALTFTLTFGCITPLAHADESHTLESNGYIVYFNAFNANFITPAVAKTYNLNRSRHRGLVNIAVHRKHPDKNIPVIAQLSGTATRLSGSYANLEFQLINEGEHLYYIAETLIGNNETLRFSISIKTLPDQPPIKLNFSKTFFTD